MAAEIWRTERKKYYRNSHRKIQNRKHQLTLNPLTTWQQEKLLRERPRQLLVSPAMSTPTTSKYALTLCAHYLDEKNFSHCGFTENVCRGDVTRVGEKEESSDGGDEEEYTSTTLDTRSLAATSGGSEDDAKEEEITEALKKKAFDVKEKSVKNAISGGSENGGKEGEEKITEALKENNSGMMDVVEEKLEDIKDMASDVKEAVEETFEDLKESASEAAEVVKDKLEDSLEKASEMLKTDEGIKSGAFFVFGLLGALGAGFYFGRTGDALGTLLLGGERSTLVKVF